MSTVKTKNVQVGTDGTASNNFTIYVPGTPDGTLRVGQGDAGAATDIAKVDSDGFKFTNSIQIGTDATASNNFTIYQPSTPDGTLRVGVGNADSPTEVGRFNSNGYKPKEPYSIYVYASSGQAIADNTGTKLQYDTVGYETGSTSHYNTSTYTWTAPYNGIYLVNHFVEFNATSVHSGLFLNSGQNASKGLKDNWNQSGNTVTTTSHHSQYINRHLNLVAGDYLEFYVYQASGATRTIFQNRSGFNITLLTLL